MPVSRLVRRRVRGAWSGSRGFRRRLVAAAARRRASFVAVVRPARRCRVRVAVGGARARAPRRACAVSARVARVRRVRARVAARCRRRVRAARPAVSQRARRVVCSGRRGPVASSCRYLASPLARARPRPRPPLALRAARVASLVPARARVPVCPRVSLRCVRARRPWPARARISRMSRRALRRRPVAGARPDPASLASSRARVPVCAYGSCVLVARTPPAAFSAARFAVDARAISCARRVAFFARSRASAPSRAPVVASFASISSGDERSTLSRAVRAADERSRPFMTRRLRWDSWGSFLRERYGSARASFRDAPSSATRRVQERAR